MELTFTDYVDFRGWKVRRDMLPPGHEQSIPTLFKKQFGKKIPENWKDALHQGTTTLKIERIEK